MCWPKLLSRKWIHPRSTLLTKNPAGGTAQTALISLTTAASKLDLGLLGVGLHQ
jgi:hypothetical protein